MSKQGMTRLLHTILAIAAGLAAALFFWVLPVLGQGIREAAPEYAWAYWPCLIWAWTFALPIFAAVAPAWQVFTSISAAGGAFTAANARRLHRIGLLAFADAVIFPAGVVLLGSLGAGQAGLTLVLAPIVTFCCIAVGAAAVCLGYLVDDAVRLREENDLTI